MLHIVLHLAVPLLVAAAFYRERLWRSYLVMLAGVAIDIDHLLADPIYDPDRCSVGFHPLHTAVPIALYVALLLRPKTRLLGIGLCLHIVLDALDCVA